MNNLYFRYAPYNYKKYFDVLSHLFRFELVSFAMSAVCVKLVNHLYHMWTSLSVIYGIYTSPALTTLSLMYTEWFSLEWFRCVLFNSTVPQFAFMKIADLKTLINYLPSAVQYLAVDGFAWFGVYDYQTLLLRTNAKIAELNAEMSVFVHHRNLFAHSLILFTILYVFSRNRSVMHEEQSETQTECENVLMY